MFRYNVVIFRPTLLFAATPFLCYYSILLLWCYTFILGTVIPLRCQCDVTWYDYYNRLYYILQVGMTTIMNSITYYLLITIPYIDL
jgi:hypothetical protein